MPELEIKRVAANSVTPIEICLPRYSRGSFAEAIGRATEVITKFRHPD